MLALDPTLPGAQIILRESQVKYETKYNRFEILDRNKYRAGYLNRQIITLLSSLGVPDQVFRDLQNEYLQSLEELSLKDSSIYKYFNAEYDGQLLQIQPVTKLIAQMLNMNVDFSEDAFMAGVIKTLKSRAYLTLRKKQNIVVPKAARLLGVLDEYSILEEDELYCAYSLDDNEVHIVEGDVVIVRNPCLHCT